MYLKIYIVVRHRIAHLPSDDYLTFLREIPHFSFCHLSLPSGCFKTIISCCVINTCGLTIDPSGHSVVLLSSCITTSTCILRREWSKSSTGKTQNTTPIVLAFQAVAVVVVGLFPRLLRLQLRTLKCGTKK